MKKLNLLWRLFTISALLLVIVSIFAVSRPLGDSTLDQISALMPFITAYYIVFGLHMLGKYEERTESVEKKFKGYSFKTW
jgi:hypothetical protein